jgi:hypothetical protein
MISISGLRDLRQRLADLDLRDVRTAGLARAAAVIEESVRQDLSPEQAALSSSVGSTIGEDRAVVGSTNPRVPDIELGSRAKPPDPIITRAADALAEEAANIVAASVVEALKGG